MEMKIYETPQLEVLELAVEQGFAASNATGEDWGFEGGQG